MKILFIRHGRTTGDDEDRYGGDYDDHLSVQGQEQAKILAEELKKYPVEYIVSSPLMRARETAEIISQGSIPVKIEPQLKERNQYGVLTGKIKSIAKHQQPELVEKLKDRFETLQGAESYDKFVNRIQQAFDILISNKKNNCVAVVWHGGPMKVLFREILMKGEVECGDCAWVELENKNQDLIIVNSKKIEFLF
ncbi:MAG: histidine phosphatase family protein [Candidatus Doudnabacteria bacterium]|nr:histidine phosphatase family protein [Candidatus Doudnabacteria bacterium]